MVTSNAFVLDMSGSHLLATHGRVCRTPTSGRPSRSNSFMRSGGRAARSFTTSASSFQSYRRWDAKYIWNNHMVLTAGSYNLCRLCPGV